MSATTRLTLDLKHETADLMRDCARLEMMLLREQQGSIIGFSPSPWEMLLNRLMRRRRAFLGRQLEQHGVEWRKALEELADEPVNVISKQRKQDKKPGQKAGRPQPRIED